MDLLSHETELASGVFDEAVDAAALIAQTFVPQFAAYILLGRAIAHAAPELYQDAVKLVMRADPTPQEKADLVRKLQALAKPEQA